MNYKAYAKPIKDLNAQMMRVQHSLIAFKDYKFSTWLLLHQDFNQPNGPFILIAKSKYSKSPEQLAAMEADIRTYMAELSPSLDQQIAAIELKQPYAALVKNINCQTTELTDLMAHIYAELSYIASENHGWEQSAAWVEAAQALKPKSLRYLMMLAAVYYRWEQFHLALETYDRALVLEPKNPVIYFGRCFAHVGQNDKFKALSELEKGIAIDPNNVQCLFHRAHLFVDLYMYELALKDFERTAKLVPNHPGSWINHGLVLVHMKRYADAIISCNNAIAVAGKEPMIFFNRAMVYALLGKSKEAMADLDVVINSHEVHNSLPHSVTLRKCIQNGEQPPRDYSTYLRMVPILSTSFDGEDEDEDDD
jgi:tetratricopeptide (TPR) repeat protein